MTQEFRAGRWITRDHTSAAEQASQIAVALSRRAGTTIVFVLTTASAERQAKNYPEAEDDEFKRERRELSNYVANIIGREHPLPSLIKRGVAFHHSQLPPEVQRSVELGVAEGWLKVVYATPTLREGMNTAATNVIVAGISYYDQSSKKPVELSTPDFLNYCGRSGRPFRDTEGLAVLVPSVPDMGTGRKLGERYLISEEDAHRVRSQFHELALLVQKRSLDFRELRFDAQAVILGLDAAAEFCEIELEDLLRETLWSAQVDDPQFEIAARAFARAVSRVKDRADKRSVDSASRLGISLTSSEVLLDRLASNLSKLQVESEKGISPNLLGTLIEQIIGLPEFWRQKLESSPSQDPHDHGEMVHAWIEGASYERLRALGKETGVLGSNPSVNDAVYYCSSVATWLSWATGAISYMLKEHLWEECPDYLAELPLQVRYGVSTVAAAYASMVGVVDRRLATQIAEEVSEIETKPSLGEMKEYVSNYQRPHKSGSAAFALRFLPQAHRGTSAEGSLVWTAYARLRYSLNVGSICLLRREKREIIVVNEYDEEVGYLTHSNLNDISSFSAHMYSAGLAVVASKPDPSSGDSRMVIFTRPG